MKHLVTRYTTYSIKLVASYGRLLPTIYRDDQAIWGTNSHTAKSIYRWTRMSLTKEEARQLVETGFVTTEYFESVFTKPDTSSWSDERKARWNAGLSRIIAALGGAA